jgi:hypothetical protein
MLAKNNKTQNYKSFSSDSTGLTSGRKESHRADEKLPKSSANEMRKNGSFIVFDCTTIEGINFEEKDEKLLFNG